MPMTLFSLGLLVCLSCVPVLAESQEGAAPVSQELPSVEEILQKNLTALGGKDLVEKLTSTISKGRFEGQGTILPVELAYEVPEKWYFRLEGGSGPAFMQVSNGTEGWIVTPGGVQEMPEIQRLLTERIMDIQGPLHFRDHYIQLETKRKDKEAGRDVYVVEAVPAGGKAETYYFDAHTGLIARIDFIADLPQGSFPVEMYFEDYQEVQGTKVPFTLRQSGPGDWLISLDKVELNQDIDEARFQKPGE